MSARIWAYGAHRAFPSFDFGLAPVHTDNDSSGRLDEKPLTDPTFSPLYGVDLLGDLIKSGCDLHISQYIGTEDLFYRQNLRLEEYLTDCGVSHTMRIVGRPRGTPVARDNH